MHNSLAGNQSWPPRKAERPSHSSALRRPLSVAQSLRNDAPLDHRAPSGIYPQRLERVIDIEKLRHGEGDLNRQSSLERVRAQETNICAAAQVEIFRRR